MFKSSVLCVSSGADDYAGGQSVVCTTGGIYTFWQWGLWAAWPWRKEWRVGPSHGAQSTLNFDGGGDGIYR